MMPDELARSFHLEQFQDFLTLEQGSSPLTTEAYTRDLSRFAVFCAVKGSNNPDEVTPKLAREYVYHMKDLGLAASSMRRNISSIRTYYKFLLNEGITKNDPSERLETPKRWRTLPDVLSAQEVEQLLAMPNLDEPLIFRD